jgi:hypothetical protein
MDMNERSFMTERLSSLDSTVLVSVSWRRREREKEREFMYVCMGMFSYFRTVYSSFL